MFSYTKSHRTNYCFFPDTGHPSPLPVVLQSKRCQCQLLYCHTSTFPHGQFWRSLSSNKGTTSSKSVKHTCCPTAVIELVLGHHLFAVTQTKVHLVDGCVSRLWGNNIKNYSAPPKTLKHAIRMLTGLKLWEIRGFRRWSIFAFTHVSPVNDVMG